MTQQDRQIEVGDLVRYDHPGEPGLQVWKDRQHQDAIVTGVPDTPEGWYSLTTIEHDVFDPLGTWSAHGRSLRLVAKATYERLD